MKLIQDFNTFLVYTVNLNSTRFGQLENGGTVEIGAKDDALTFAFTPAAEPFNHNSPITNHN